MASDSFLASQLHGFMVAIPELWTWDQLRQIYRGSTTHNEQRGPEEALLQFQLAVLEDSAKDGRRYLHIAVAVTDATRGKQERGSSYIPLSTSFLLYEGGELDAPSVTEILKTIY